MEKDTKIIMERMKPLFKRLYQTRYGIVVADDSWDKRYNFFFWSQKKGQWQRSIPLHSLENYDLVYLEKIIGEIKTQTQLSIQFVNFDEKRWPSDLRPIR